jgi:ribosomal protein S18 acetylase RimI-like enzyme
VSLIVPDLLIRPAVAADASLLWRMLTFAASMAGTADDEAAAQADPDLRPYVEGFGRAGDLGVVALTSSPVGAAWLRLPPNAEPVSPSKVWTLAEPELAIAVELAMRGRGVGAALLESLLDAAAGHYPAVRLSVREGNPAVRLYERFGFVTERSVTNRVGGVSLVMRRVLRVRAQES